MRGLADNSDGSDSSSVTPLAQSLIERFLSDGVREILEKARYIVSEDKRAKEALAQLEVHLSTNAEKNDTVKLLNTIKHYRLRDAVRI